MSVDFDLAHRIHNYMQYRARREGVAHDLPVTFYQEMLHAGIHSIFGIAIADGALVDSQQPHLLADWLAEETHRP